MRIVALINERGVIERILRHVGLPGGGGRDRSGPDPPCDRVLEPWQEDPFPDYGSEPVMDYECA